MPLGDLASWIFAHLPPVGATSRGRALQAEEHAPQHLVLGGAIKVDHQELHGDVRQQLRWNVVDEGLVEDGVERALFDMRLLLGDAFASVEHVHLHIWI